MRIIGVSPRRDGWIFLGIVLWLTRSATAQYVDLSAQIEVSVWSKQPDTPSFFQDSLAELQPITVHCVVSSNSWVMDGVFFGNSDRMNYWFTGTNMVEYNLVNGVAPPAYSRVSASNDGNPGSAHQADQLTMVARIAWLAFCSGPCLKGEGREVFPPSDLWKDLLTAKRFSDETVTFDDTLGLPKVMNLTAGNGQPIFQYRAVSSTNVSGWEFPLEFKVAQYRPVHGFPRVTIETNGWQLEFTATGKVTAIRPESQPRLPRVTIGTNGWRLQFPASARPTAAGSGAGDAATRTGGMLITHAGAYTSPDGKWRVEVRLDDGSLHVSHVRSTGSSTISVGGWTAQTGWFAFVESDARVWAFDGVRNLSLTTHKSNTSASETLISYGPNRFPCAVPSEVGSRLPEAFRQTIIANE